MLYKKVSIKEANEDNRAILIAQLSEAGYEGFEEGESTLFAFVPDGDFDEEMLKEVLALFGNVYEVEEIAQRNWNEVWEASIEPVIVDDFCTIRTDFHQVEIDTPYTVIITPKMSFGTGHHATTQLMMMGMRNLDFAGKSVLDFGTGTGVLAILAYMLGSRDITAIDNDEWAVTNTIENLERNNVAGIVTAQASLEGIARRTYDVILANINRHILLAYMEELYARVANGGKLLMSGLLTEDEQIICDAANKAGFSIRQVEKRNGWISVLAEKQ